MSNVLGNLDLTRYVNGRRLLKISLRIYLLLSGIMICIHHPNEVYGMYQKYQMSNLETDYQNFIWVLSVIIGTTLATVVGIVLLLIAHKYPKTREYLRKELIWTSISLPPGLALVIYMKLWIIQELRWTRNEIIHTFILAFMVMTKLYFMFLVLQMYRKFDKVFKPSYKIKIRDDFSYYNLKRLGKEKLPEFIRKSSLEIPKIKLNTDYSRILGEGQSGVVYYGEFLDIRMNSIVHIPVAVKTANDSIEDGNGTGKTNVETLIAEIKLLHLIGEHKNVVKLLGVCLHDFNDGRLSVAFELCRDGSMESFLRKIRVEKQTDLESDDERNLILITMNKWVYEVANAMEFVSAKNIIHGDIATRNILISSDLTAKLTDFGLSRKIYNYVNYIKTRQEPLPWRWMAPESLRDLEFSKKSDVWSFGVFTWEVFQFASTLPYLGINWCSDFVRELESGLIPHKPEFAQENMYNLMKRCWTFHPDNRPTFTEIRTILQKQMLVKSQSLECQ